MRSFAKKSMHESCRMGWRIEADSLICSLGHCECEGHTVHKLSRRRLTVNCLAPRESDCLPLRSKISFDWLLSYIKATRPFLEIFRMVGYIPDRPRTFIHSSQSVSCKSIVSSKASSPQTAIYCICFHFPISSCSLAIQ
jgi:hypothetical protein